MARMLFHLDYRPGGYGCVVRRYRLARMQRKVLRARAQLSLTRILARLLARAGLGWHP